MLNKLLSQILIEAASLQAAQAYLVLMGVASVTGLALAALGGWLAVPVVMATGLADLLLHAAGRVRARLPVSIPLGVLAAVVCAARQG